VHSPVEQFTIKVLYDLHLFGYDISFTNSALFMILAVLVSTIFLVMAMRPAAIVPGRMQAAAEMMYEFVADMVRSNVGSEGRPYFPFIFTLFVFVLFSNLLGMLPYSYTTTSQIIVTFAMAFFIFIAVTLIGLVKHGMHFFSFFVPPGAPKPLYPLIILIEVVSYFVRPVSLSVRLFANMLAGHTMLKVFAGLAVMMTGAGGLAAAMSTADGLLLAIANALSHDLYYKIIDPKADTKTRLLVARILLLGVGAAGALVASLKLTSILGAVAWAFCFANSGLFFPLVLGIWWKRANRQGAIAGMIGGFLAGFAYLYYVQFAGGTPWLGLDGLRFGMIGMPVSAVLMIAVSLMTEEPDAETQKMVDEIRIPSGKVIQS